MKGLSGHDACADRQPMNADVSALDTGGIVTMPSVRLVPSMLPASTGRFDSNSFIASPQGDFAGD
jgi:hypothetical protein